LELALSCSTILSTALSRPRFTIIGLAPAGDVLEALGDERLAEHDCGRRAVAGDVVRLGRDFLQELGAHVLEGVFELDLAGDGHAVVRDRRRAELLVEDDVAALGTKGHLDRIGELVDTALEAASGSLVINQLLSPRGGVTSDCRTRF
jgi:hypothetical protein